MQILKAAPINYDRRTDTIETTGGWDAVALDGIRQMIADGDEHELVEVLGWGEASHRLSFTGESISAGHDREGEFVGFHFLVALERVR